MKKKTPLSNNLMIIVTNNTYNDKINTNKDQVLDHDDNIDDILDTYKKDFTESELMSKLDRLYSESINSGLISEDNIKNRFKNFINKNTTNDNITSKKEFSLYYLFLLYKKMRKINNDDISTEFGITINQLEKIEKIEKKFDFFNDEIVNVVNVITSNVNDIKLDTALRLVQRMRVVIGISDSKGSILKAARRKPSVK
jgi:hypothetical protein